MPPTLLYCSSAAVRLIHAWGVLRSDPPARARHKAGKDN